MFPFSSLLRAEVLAAQIKELQCEMADYNTLMDKLNTDTEIDDILSDCEMVRLLQCTVPAACLNMKFPKLII